METVTFTAPAVCAGVLALMLVEPVTTTPVAAAPPKLTVAPERKFAPPMLTVVPPEVEPLAGVTVLTTGAGFVFPVTETPSMLAVHSTLLLWLVTASPTYTVPAMLMVSLPTCTQFTPSEDTAPVNVVPLRATFTQ